MTSLASRRRAGWSSVGISLLVAVGGCGSNAGAPSATGGAGGNVVSGSGGAAPGSGGGPSGSGGAASSSGGAPGSGGASASGGASGGSSMGGAGGSGAAAVGGQGGRMNGGGAAGTTSGSGGRNAAGGAGGIRFGMGGPFPFPQNKVSGMCTLTTVADAAQTVQTAYDEWKTTFVSANGAGAAGNLRVVRTTDSNDTVSEGIGYGMLAAVYMGDRATFDGLWSYAKSHFDGKGLMHWQINASNVVIGMGSATDADEDIAWALLMASNQWSSTAYLDDAKGQINGMVANSVASDGLLKPGDAWGNTSATFPDYFSPAYFPAFAAATNNPRWTGDIMDRNYEILMAVSGDKGLVPDRTTGTYQHNGITYLYDACRTPWRIAMDYCFRGEARAKTYLNKIGAFFDGIGAANIVDGYSLTGTPTGTSKNMAFIGPAGVAGMAGWPKLLDDAFTYGAQNLGGQQYYPQSLKIITMQMMSGNFLDYSRL